MSVEQIQTAYASRPTLTLAGRDDPDLAADLIALSVEEDTGGLGRCELRIACEPSRLGRYPYLEPDRLRLGRPLAVTLGRPGRRREVFSGTVTAVEGRHGGDGVVEVVVLAEDALQRLRLRRRTRVFEDVTDADVAQRIAGEHGLTADVDGGATSHPVLVQLGVTDLAFLRERAASFGADLWLDGSRLHLSARSGSAELTVTYGVELVDLTLRADLAGQSTTVGVAGWDVAAKDAVDETATGSDMEPTDTGGTSGWTLLEEAFGERVETVMTTVPLTRAAARALARSAFARQSRRFVTGSGTSDGDPRIRVGSRLRLARIGRIFEGDYAVTRTCHHYDGQRGYLTTFDVERAVLTS